MSCPTTIDNVWPGDMVIIHHRWPLQTTDYITTGFVVGESVSGSAIHRMPMNPPRRDECYLRIEVFSAEPPKYEMVMAATIRQILLTGRGEAHEAARKEFRQWMAGVEASP